MDPDATWELFLAAELTRDREAVREIAEVLAGWLARGGFLPRHMEALGYTKPAALHMLRTVRAVAEFH
jgi:hypothetical protein